MIWAVRPNDVLLVVPALFALRGQRQMFLYCLTLSRAFQSCISTKSFTQTPRFLWPPLCSSTGGRSAAFWDTNFIDGLYILFRRTEARLCFFHSIFGSYLWVKLMPPLKIKELFSDALRFRLPNWIQNCQRNPAGFSNALLGSDFILFRSLGSTIGTALGPTVHAIFTICSLAGSYSCTQ